ncbi:hypothetical protein IWW38_003944, partial [Coemansia aciculifera]
ILVDNEQSMRIDWNASKSTVEIDNLKELHTTLDEYGFMDSNEHSLKKNIGDYRFTPQFDDRGPMSDAAVIV